MLLAIEQRRYAGVMPKVHGLDKLFTFSIELVAMVYVTRQSEFSASHRLHSPNLSDSENCRIFGKCNNPNGHGHNYVLEVTIAGELDPTTGMVIDLTKLKKIVDREIVQKVDHKNLSLDVSFLEGVVPTAENLVIRFWEILFPKIKTGRLYEIKLYESTKNFVVYRGAKK